MSQKSVLLYLPASLKNNAPTGGQVIAARGLIEYIEKETNIKYSLIDHGNAARLGAFKTKATLFSNFSELVFNVSLYRYSSFLCFSSSYTGLLIRFLPALILKSKGCKTSIFFRNANIYDYQGFKLYLAKILLSPYDLCFTQGSNLKKHLISIGIRQESVQVIPSWLSPDFTVSPKQKIKDNTPIKFVFASKLIKNKGIYSLIEAFSKDIDSESAKLDIYGWGPESENIDKLIKSLKLENMISMHGEIPHDKLMSTLKDYDVFILPSLYEGFPNAILEALALGLPVIASNVGEITDTVKDGINGYIIHANSSDSIRLAIQKYINDPQLISEHSKAAIDAVSLRHNWYKNCSMLLKKLLK